MAGTITGLSVQKRNPNRLNIEVDGSFGFGLDRIVAGWLQIGQWLSDDQIKDLVTKDTQEVLYQAALRLIGWRFRSRKELLDRLTRKGFEKGNIEIVLARLEASGLLDDAKFAKDWVTDRSEFHPRSKKMLTLEMRQKGIAPEAITDAVQDLKSDELLAAAAARKAIRRWQRLPEQEFTQKCSNFLVRRGFSYTTIRAVIPVLWLENQDLEK